MDVFFRNLWIVLVNTYNLTASNGYLGCAIAFGTGLALVKYATRLNGVPEQLHGSMISGVFHVHRRTAAVPGTGKGLGDRLIALVCNVVGTVLLMIALIAVVNVAMYGPRATTHILDRLERRAPSM